VSTTTKPVRHKPADAASVVATGTSRHWLLFVAVSLVFVAVIAVLPGMDIDSYLQAVLYNIAFYAAMAQAWNLMSGFTGYISFAHGALAGVGSYAAVLAMNAGAPLVLAVLVAAVVASLASILIGLPSLRLRGIAFAFATIFFQAAVLIAANKASWLTGGSQGLAATAIVPLEHLLLGMLLVAGAATGVVYGLRHSRLGLRLLAIREDETAAQVLGIRTVRLKLGAFAVSAAFAGAAGGVHAFYLATIFPANVFDLQGSLEPLVIALMGGAGSPVGPVVMAAVYGYFQELLQTLGSELQLSLLGLLLVVVVLFARDGLAGVITTAYERIRARGRDS
jgi:branched-chain amino acid transport system permease protein